jgi:hypothetical protein
MVAIFAMCVMRSTVRIKGSGRGCMVNLGQEVDEGGAVAAQHDIGALPIRGDRSG